MPENTITTYTFPIALLQGGFSNIGQCVDQVLLYTAYGMALRYKDLGTEAEMMAAAGKRLGLIFNDPLRASQEGQELYAAHRKSPLTTIPAARLHAYHRSSKNEFDIACLLGFAALTSLLEGRAWNKTTKAEIFARMYGYASYNELRGRFRDSASAKYLKRYHMDRLLRELENNWGLCTFSHQTTGLYFGFGGVTLHDLALINEQHKHRPKDNSRQLARATALAHAKAALGRTTPTSPTHHQDTAAATLQGQRSDTATAPQQQQLQQQKRIQCQPHTATIPTMTPQRVPPDSSGFSLLTFDFPQNAILSTPRLLERCLMSIGKH